MTGAFGKGQVIIGHFLYLLHDFATLIDGLSDLLGVDLKFFQSIYDFFVIQDIAGRAAQRL